MATKAQSAINPPCGAINVQSAFAQSSSTSDSCSNVPQNLCVPTLAYDQTSIWLAWNTPPPPTNSTNRVVDYNVYRDGRLIGTANGGAAANPVKPYFDAFYEADRNDGFHTKIAYHSFKAEGLRPNTTYKFTIRSVDSNGKESKDSIPLMARTASPYARIVDIAKLGAVGDGRTLNTAIIQRAIDQCAVGSMSAFGCQVFVPSNNGTSGGSSVYLTGALFLRSNMTLEIEAGATLLGSPNSADYPLDKGYQIYSFFTNPTDDRRPPSLLNVLSEEHRNGPSPLADHQGYDERRGTFQNIRVTGRGGALDGNGWVRSGTDLVDETGASVPQFDAGNSKTWATLGRLAKSQMEAANGTSATQNDNYYSNRRSSLATFRGVRNFYFGDLSLTNPAFHGVMLLECENTVFANTVTQTYDINNADGVEFGNSRNAVVFNNVVNSGDDCINFAAGQGREYEQGKEPQQFAWIFNNYMREGHGAVVAGSHTGAWIQDILAEDNVAFLTDNGFRVKSTPATGGGVRRVLFRRNAMREIGTKNKGIAAGGRLYENGGGNGSPVVLTLAYSAGSNEFVDATMSAQFRDITVSGVSVNNGGANVTASGGGPMIAVDGYNGNDLTLPYLVTYHTNLQIIDAKFTNVKPAIIARLANSTFTNVSITNWAGGAASSPWSIANSTNLRFVNVNPMPVGF